MRTPGSSVCCASQSVLARYSGCTNPLVISILGPVRRMHIFRRRHRSAGTLLAASELAEDLFVARNLSRSTFDDVGSGQGIAHHAILIEDIEAHVVIGED